jgi:hypothetical protein
VYCGRAADQDKQAWGPTKTESDKRKRDAKPHIFRYADRGWGSKKMRAGLKRRGIPVSRPIIDKWRREWGLMRSV